MAIIKPFKAVRPLRDKVGLFATRTYLSYSRKVLKDKLETMNCWEKYKSYTCSNNIPVVLRNVELV